MCLRQESFVSNSPNTTDKGFLQSSQRAAKSLSVSTDVVASDNRPVGIPFDEEAAEVRRTSFSWRSGPRRTVRPYPSPARPTARRREPEPTSEWEVGIYGDLTEKQADLINQLLELPRFSRGTIFFDSSGGSVYVGLALASLIRLRGLRAVGVVAGECSSAAILPWAACEERYTTPHATFLFHEIRWSSDGEVRFQEAAEWAKHFKFLEEDLDRLTARLLNFPEKKLQQWIRRGRFVTGQEVVDAGLAKMVDLFSGDLWAQIRRHRTASG